MMPPTEEELHEKFRGDGRRFVKPTSLPGIPVKRSIARFYIDQFFQRGRSEHGSPYGVSWVIIEQCTHMSVSITITDEPGYRLIQLRPRCADLAQQIAYLESLRPHWAKGYTDDSIAAQTYLAALNQIYDALGVKTQTDCMKAIHKLKEKKA